MPTIKVQSHATMGALICKMFILKFVRMGKYAYICTVKVRWWSRRIEKRISFPPVI